MHLLSLIAPVVVLATSVVGGPSPSSAQPMPTPVSISINRLINTDSTGMLNIVHNDNLRLRCLLDSDRLYESSITGVPLDDLGFLYTVQVGVGSPPSFYQLVVDTGSSNTWLGANKVYNKTKTSVDTHHRFNETYGTARVNGTEFIDTVTICKDLVVIQQSIGVATNSSGVSPVDGILGLGPTDLTKNTVSPYNSTTIATVTDNLVYQRTIEHNVIAISLTPSNSTSGINFFNNSLTSGSPELNGELNFGGTDSNKYIGDITYHNITKAPHASKYYGLDASFRYGSNKDILRTSPGIVDTGTTLLYLNSNAYDRYVNATGARFDNVTGLLRIPLAHYSNLQSLFFIVDGISYEINPNAQLFPRTFSPYIGGDAKHLYLIVNNLNSVLHTDSFEYIVGMTFLQRYYSIYDKDLSRVGFAKTTLTNATDIN